MESAASRVRASTGSVSTGTLQAGGVAALLFAATFIIMVGCVVAPALPQIAMHLGMEHHQGWLVTLPSAGVVLFGPAAGWIAARGISSRSAMLGGLAAYGALGPIAPLLHRWPLLVVVDRLLLGAATAVLLASNTSLIASFFHGEKRLRMIAWQGMATEGGGIVLLALGGLLGALSWQLPFLLYALAFVCFACVFFWVPSTLPIHQEAIDDAPETSSDVIVALASATLSMMLFFVAVLTLPVTLAATVHLGAAGIGYLLSYISLCAVLCISLMPRMLRYLGPGSLQCVAFALFGAAHLLFAKSSNLAGVLLAGATIGCAFAFSVPLSSHLIVELSPIAQRARNLGYLSTSIFLGQVLSSLAGYVSRSGQTVMMVAGCLGFSLAALRWLREMATNTRQTPNGLTDAD